MKNILAALILAVSFNASALDTQNASDTYFALQEELSQGRNSKSTSVVIMEGVVVSGRIGTSVIARELLRGPISKAVIRSVSQPLYEEYGYGVYSYQGFLVNVWFEGNNSSVITLMAYTP